MKVAGQDGDRYATTLPTYRHLSMKRAFGVGKLSSRYHLWRTCRAPGDVVVFSRWDNVSKATAPDEDIR